MCTKNTRFAKHLIPIAEKSIASVLLRLIKVNRKKAKKKKKKRVLLTVNITFFKTHTKCKGVGNGSPDVNSLDHDKDETINYKTSSEKSNWCRWNTSRMNANSTCIELDCGYLHLLGCASCCVLWSLVLLLVALWYGHYLTCDMNPGLCTPLIYFLTQRYNSLSTGHFEQETRTENKHYNSPNIDMKTWTRIANYCSLDSDNENSWTYTNRSEMEIVYLIGSADSGMYIFATDLQIHPQIRVEFASTWITDWRAHNCRNVSNVSKHCTLDNWLLLLRLLREYTLPQRILYHRTRPLSYMSTKMVFVFVLELEMLTDLLEDFAAHVYCRNITVIHFMRSSVAESFLDLTIDLLRINNAIRFNTSHHIPANAFRKTRPIQDEDVPFHNDQLLYFNRRIFGSYAMVNHTVRYWRVDAVNMQRYIQWIESENHKFMNKIHWYPMEIKYLSVFYDNMFETLLPLRQRYWTMLEAFLGIDKKLASLMDTKQITYIADTQLRKFRWLHMEIPTRKGVWYLPKKIPPTCSKKFVNWKEIKPLIAHTWTLKCLNHAVGLMKLKKKKKTSPLTLRVAFFFYLVNKHVLKDEKKKGKYTIIIADLKKKKRNFNKKFFCSKQKNQVDALPYFLSPQQSLI
ncbi:hypothetical protein RFI_21511 [Reticulomyxa filosa]|uniref:Uncharacterized protein n=1 Tax=Reticulomyxa filosa TaxID=46433 RepID=X6MPT1_RETFI|nr:hypothetical protein RFI_21511 [Reticulomyxa filosa]|eukprot:ETO15854.1 hypothetical protein RFI_21511 [Reticulomyxa filosa]